VKRPASASKTYRFTAPLERSENKLWGAHLEVPARVALLLSGPDDRRVVCRLNNEAEYQCALLPHGGGTFVVTVNKRLRERLGAGVGADVEVELRRDTSAYGLPVPEELAEIFRREKEGKALFHALTKGKQRTLLYIAGAAKDPAARARRAVAIVRHLCENGGSINYKQLASALKDPRRASPTKKPTRSLP
jgi:hypothetical protein